MNITNKDLGGVIDGFRELSQRPLPFPLSLEIAPTLKKLVEVYEVLEESRRKIFDRYAAKNEEGKYINPETGEPSGSNMMIAPDNAQPFADELNELLLTDVDHDINKLDLRKWKKQLETVELEPIHLAKILDFVEV